MTALETMKTALLGAAILLGLAVQCPVLTGAIATGPEPAANTLATPAG